MIIFINNGKAYKEVEYKPLDKCDNCIAYSLCDTCNLSTSWEHITAQEILEAMGDKFEYYYIEDHQMYYTEVYKFSLTEPINTNVLEGISRVPPAAGRISTSFGQFKDLLNNYGIKMTDSEHIGRDFKDFPEDASIVKGATGNY